MKNRALIIKFTFIWFLPFYFTSTMSQLKHYNNADDPIKTSYLQNRAPLAQKPFMELPIGSIKPLGWLHTQLITMKNGSTGHLDDLYNEVMGKRNGWLGGDGDVWERGPYWLDGLVPLAYILDDKQLIDKVKPWVEWSIKHQRADGYFGPEPSQNKTVPEPGLQKDRAQDWWPKMVMLKVLKQYYSATGDKRVIELMTRYFHYQLKELPTTPLNQWSWWGAQRGGDNLMVVYWLYNITGDDSLLQLAKLIHKQTYDWTDTLLNTDRISRPFTFHGVNLAQGIKEPIIYYQQAQNAKYVESVQKGLKDIRKFLGQPQGMYGADELTHGNSPTQGSEFCSAVELMFSLENMMEITGDVEFMDHLEKIAFNALPSQASDDYMTRQYYQQPNQVMISRQPRNFITTYNGTDQCFGLLTGYPCCTSNMHQGWPKFTQNLWMASADHGVAALLFAPSSVRLKVADGTLVEFVEQTQYPFDEAIHFTYKNKGPQLSFPFHLRIPAWCKKGEIRVNGEKLQEAKGGQVVKIDRIWKDGDEITLTLPMEVSVERWNENAVSIERGPLTYALKIEEEWKKVKNNDPYGDYFEVLPQSPWNYALMNVKKEDWQKAFKVVKKSSVSDKPWNINNAPIEIEAKAVLLPDWTMYNGSAGPLPYSPLQMPENGKPVSVTLIPYGCTTLRIAEFPTVE
jgi:DUF1680 family protein